MPTTAITIGRVLILIGIVGYAYGLFSAKASITAMIPALFGVTLLILGHLARAKENLSKHLMHGAVLVAAAGFVLPAARIFAKRAEFAFSAAFVSLVLMSLACLIFVVLAVRSFAKVRAG